MPRGSQHSTDQKLEVAGKDPAPRGPHLTLDPWSLPVTPVLAVLAHPGFIPSLQQPQETDTQTRLSPPGLSTGHQCPFPRDSWRASATVQLLLL